MNIEEKLNWIAQHIGMERLSPKMISLLGTMDGPVAVGCSGGSDSVFLVLWILAHFPCLRQRLCLLHFNHKLRGNEADEDARFVQNLAKDLNIPCYQEERQGSLKKVTEGNLRDLRNQFFERQMKKIGARFLLLGQQMDDVAETLLMRLMRASGIKGLSAPKAVVYWKQQFYKVRPLLGFRKTEIEQTLVTIGQDWRVDSSNLEDDFLRNRVRHRILPSLEEAMPSVDVIRALAAVRNTMQELDEMVEFYTQKFSFSTSLDVKDIIELPMALQRSCLERFCVVNDIQFTRSLIDQLLNVINGNKTEVIQVKSDVFLKFYDAKLMVNKKTDYVSFEKIALEDGGLMWEGQVIRKKILSPQELSLISWSKIAQLKECVCAVNKGAEIRVGRFISNLRYCPYGKHSFKKLKDLITSKNLDGLRKENLPVFWADDEVVWVPSLPVSAHFCVKNSDKTILLLTWS